MGMLRIMKRLVQSNKKELAVVSQGPVPRVYQGFTYNLKLTTKLKKV